LTCGVDVQEDRLELEVVGWGVDEESWGITNYVIPGNPTQIEVWDELDKYIFNSKFTHESGQQLRILATAVDSGFLTKMVYAFVRPRESSRVYATKGISGEARPIISGVSRKQKGQQQDTRKVNLYSIGVDEAKTILHRRLRYTEVGSGYCHFPNTPDYNEEYFAQLAAEKKVKKHKKGFTHIEWQKTRPRNEKLDIRVLAHAALLIMNPNWEVARSYIEEGKRIAAEDKAAEDKGAPAIQRQPSSPRRVRSKGVM